MDQLKQVLKFQFWILLGIALILPLVGWTMATSGLSSEAEARAKALTTLNGSLTVNGDDPNKDWESGLQVINEEQGKQAQIAQKALYFERQLPLMTWPSEMPSDPAKIKTQHQEFYRLAYRKMIEQVRKIVKPFDEESQTGLVEYPEELLPNPDLTEWVDQAPSIRQIEAAQEDIWLLSSLLKQIAAVNDSWEAKNQFEAPIRQIIDLYLRGGSKAGAAGTKAAASGGTAGGMGGMKMNFSNVGESMARASNTGAGGGMGGANAGGGSTAIASSKFTPDEDLGPEQAAPVEKSADSKVGTKGTGEGATKMSMPIPAGALSGGMGSGSGSGSNTRWSGSSMGRYREDKPEFRTRGFYLEVVMDHRRIPDLLAALANAEWPISVLRVQESDFKDEDLAEAGSAGTGLSGMGARGSMGSGSMGSMNMGRMGSRMPGGSAPGMGGAPGQGGAPRSSFSSGRGAGTARSGDDSGEGPTSMNNRSALDDPNLANVAIVGVIYIFKKPVEKPGTPAPATSAPATSAPATSTPANSAAPVAAAPASTPAAASPADAPATSPENVAGNDAENEAAAGQADPAISAPESNSDAESENKSESKSENKSEEASPPAKASPPPETLPEKTLPEKKAP